jgi:ABC-2 type transport system permease protein
MMRAMPLPALVGRSFSRAAAVFTAVAAILAGFQVLLVLVATSFQQTRSFDLLSSIVPISLQRSLGPGALMLASFPGMVTFGYFHPIVVLAVLQAAVYLATEPAGEVEWALFDLELSRPVARHWIVTRSLVLAFGLTTAVVLVMALGTWAGLTVFAPPNASWPAPARVASLGAHLLLLSWSFAAAGLAVSSATHRRGTAFTIVAVTAVSLYLLNFVADVWTPAARIRWISPFYYFPGFAVANGTAPIARDLLLLAVPTVALSAVAYWQFNRRDL